MNFKLKTQVKDSKIYLNLISKSVVADLTRKCSLKSLWESSNRDLFAITEKLYHSTGCNQPVN